jgi:hypothetical protein
MATIKPHVRRLLEMYGLDPKESIWDCHGTWVLYHSACQAIAAKLNILFSEPEIVHMNLDNKQVVIKVHGYLKDGTGERWDFGEALPSNNKNAYPVSMAQKRAEDKVILHLANLRQHGIYSSEEADDFKKKPASRKDSNDAKRIMNLINEATTPHNVNEIMTHHTDEIMNQPAAIQRQIKKAGENKFSSLQE